MKYTIAELDAMPVGTVLQNRRRRMFVKFWSYPEKAHWLEVVDAGADRVEARTAQQMNVARGNYTMRSDPQPIQQGAEQNAE